MQGLSFNRARRARLLLATKSDSIRVPNLRTLLAIGFGLTLAGVWPAILTGQSLSFLKTLPAAPPPWGAAAAAADASGIYIAEGITSLRKYDRDGAEIWSRGLEGLHIRAMAAHAAGVYAGGIAAGTESFVRLYDAQGTELWTRQLRDWSLQQRLVLAEIRYSRRRALDQAI